MNRDDKAAVIDQIAEDLGNADAVFALDYRGITVAQIAELRDKLRPTETRLRVTKNSLSERAADKAGVEELKPLLLGPTALAFVKGDAAAAAKVLNDTSRALRGPLAFKGGIMGGAVLSPGDVQAIAQLPPREVLIAQLVGTIAAPVSGLARTLNALISGLAVQLGQIRDQGLVSGAAPSAPAEEAAAEPEAEAVTEPEAEAVTEPEAEAATETDPEPATDPETVAAEATEVAEADSPSAPEASDDTAAPQETDD